MNTWLKAIREEHKMSQDDVAKAAGIAQASYSNIESGKRAPSVSVAKKIASALDFDWTRLYEEAEPEEEREGA